MSNILILLLLTLALAAFLAFDLKMAWEFYHHGQEAHEEDGTFLLWWARKNVVKFIVIGGVYLLLALILLMPEFTLFLRNIKFKLRHLVLMVITMSLAGYMIYDLKMAQEFYRITWEATGKLVRSSGGGQGKMSSSSASWVAYISS